MCKLLADSSSAFLESFDIPVTLYEWNNGAFAGVWDAASEDDALGLCEQFGMPDRWASGPIRRRVTIRS